MKAGTFLLPDPAAGAIRWRCVLLALAAGAFAHSVAGNLPADGVAEATPAPLPATVPAAARTAAAVAPDFTGRPLFHPSRRPWTAAAAAPAETPAAAPVAPPAQWSLSGVMRGGGAAVAVLRVPSQPAAIVLHEGDTLDGWTLRAIQAGRLLFEHAGQTWSLGFPRGP